MINFLFLLGFGVALQSVGLDFTNPLDIWDYTMGLWAANPPISAAGLIAVTWTVGYSLRIAWQLFAMLWW